jgi:hypothetical protein
MLVRVGINVTKAALGMSDCSTKTQAQGNQKTKN